MIHLTPQQLSSYMDGELNEVSTELVRRHMGVCEECTLKFAALEEQEEQLSHALVHEPGDDFFDRFAGEVERQLPAGSGPRRGSSSPAARAAGVREAARETARKAARVAAPRSSPARDSAVAAPFRAAEAKADRAASLPQPAPEAKPAAASLPLADDDADLDADETLAALSLDGPSDELPSAPRPSPAQRPAPEPAPRHPERKPPSPPPRARAAQRPAQRRPKIRRPAPSIPWYAALILVVIAAAAGVVASRTSTVSAWLDSHGLRSPLPNPEKPTATEPGAPASPDQGAPTREAPESPSPEGAPSGGEIGSGAAQSSDNSEAGADDFVEAQPQGAERFLTSRGTEPAAARDPFAALPPGPLAQVRAAQRSKAAADAQPSADRYDAAADGWERTIPLLRGARQQSLSRLELASSRYRAWESEPTARRAASAAAAIRAYLAFAPQGAPLDLIRNWLARVSR